MEEGDIVDVVQEQIGGLNNHHLQQSQGSM